MPQAKLLVLAVLAALVAAFFLLDLRQYLNFEFFRSQQEVVQGWLRERPAATVAGFFGLYIVLAPFGLAVFLTLAGGVLFGLLWGTVLVSFASSAGALVGFLLSRYLLGRRLQEKYGEKLKRVNEGVRREGAFYLFAMRLVPAFPFWLVNLLMGLTPMRAWTYYWVSQVGMLPGTIVYVYAGTQLGQFRLTWELGLAFALLGLFPLVAKRVLDAVKARRVYARWPRPARFQRNVVVIGAGSAGLVAAYIAAAVKAKVTLVEKHRMGGDCLNTGCVPSKALIRSAKLLARMRGSAQLGIASATAQWDFAELMERVRSVVRQVAPHDSVERYIALGVECLPGTARITSPWTVEVSVEGGAPRTLTTRNIVIAAGARPFVPPIPGLREAEPLTSDTIWDLRSLPRRLVVLGGGPIGCELAQCFARLGARVTQVEMLPRILAREDPEFSALVAEHFREDGIELLAGHKAKEVRREGEETIVVVEHDGAEKRIACDAILCAVGRIANTEGYGLEALGIPTTPQKTVEVNEYLQTVYPNIYACGDVAGPYQFTHTASHMAWYCSVNALFGRLRRFRVDYSVVPWATFTDPEVARVGLNETEAREKKVPYEVSVYGLDELDRAIADGEARGMVKVLTAPGSDRILGATIAGEHAADLLAEMVLAMRHGIGLRRILGTIHVYPTLAEANKYVAGVWRRSRVTRGQAGLGRAFNDWTRGEAGFAAVLRGLAGLRDKRPDDEMAQAPAAKP